MDVPTSRGTGSAGPFRPWRAVRRALGSLTTRGRSFVAAGITAIACAFILGERDLLRAGVLILALPLLSGVVVSRTRYRLSCTRRAEPSRLPVGHEAQVGVVLQNISRLPTGILLVEDQVPYTLGDRARFVVDRIEPGGGREMVYRIRPDIRGRYQVGPLLVRLADPFGLVELARSFTTSNRLTVTPPIVPLPHGRLTGSWTGGGESRARTISTAGEDDVAPREYRHGDDLRRVHWRSTARRGELMVRREEQQWQSRGTLFLDTRRIAHWGEGASSSFEQAVSVAASIGVQLGREGLGLRYVTDEGETFSPTTAFEGALLDSLAVARTSTGRSLRTGLAALRTTARDGDGLVVGVFGRLTAEDVQDVARSRQGTATCVAVLVGDEEHAAARAASVLRAAGWRVLTVDSAASLPAAWAGADQASENSRLRAARDRAGARPTAPANGSAADANGAGTDEAGRGGQGVQGETP
ncbi:membrane protein [Actinoallomurus iriomotensis]|uniref:Membrane protein n=1 Tax=Actinoallomurus iriomotensis TaxID=478107 RepID=A0A9W6VRW5_9ACTN|nr:membrane protein [Actinoallomurus iriomotensis]